MDHASSARPVRPSAPLARTAALALAVLLLGPGIAAAEWERPIESKSRAHYVVPKGRLHPAKGPSHNPSGVTRGGSDRDDDHDGIPNGRDSDDDGDGINDAVE
jgi:hypothetical protein